MDTSGQYGDGLLARDDLRDWHGAPHRRRVGVGTDAVARAGVAGTGTWMLGVRCG